MKLPDVLIAAGQVLMGVLAAEDRDPFARDAPFTDLFAGVGGGLAQSGVNVSARNAYTHAAFYACLKAISETFARVPAMPYIETGKPTSETRERAYDEPLYETLTRTPNRWQTPYAFQQTWALHKMLAGNFVGEIAFDRETGYELVPIVPQRLSIEQPVDERSGPTFRTWTQAGRERLLLRDEVLHDPMMSDGGWKGLSILQAAREALGIGLAISAFKSKFFSKGLTQRGIIVHPKLMSPKARANFENAIKGGLDKAGGLLLLEEDMKFFGVTVSPQDAQLLDADIFQVAQVARFFGVPLAKIGYLKEGASYASVEQFMIDFISSTMDPYFCAAEQEINRTLVTKPRMFVEFLRQALVQADLKTRWQAYAIALTSGVYAPNEVRKFEGMPKLEGLDRPLRRLDMAPANDKAAAAAAWQQWGGKAADKERRLLLGRLEEIDTSRTRALATAAARAIARSEERFLKDWAPEAGGLEALEAFYQRAGRRVARDLAVPEGRGLLWAENRGNALLEGVQADKEFDRRRFARGVVKELVRLALAQEDRHAA